MIKFKKFKRKSNILFSKVVALWFILCIIVGTTWLITLVISNLVYRIYELITWLF
jgi:ABC-type transport system involved in multi-copper enzyme maturation permease subunit